MSQVLSFVNKREKIKGEDVIKTIRIDTIVRVISPSSPFFTWEGQVIKIFSIEQEGFCQIFCAHKGIGFPVFTFNVKDLAVASDEAIFSQDICKQYEWPIKDAT